MVYWENIGVGGWLYQVILEVYSNLDGSLILNTRNNTAVHISDSYVCCIAAYARILTGFGIATTVVAAAVLLDLCKIYADGF